MEHRRIGPASAGRRLPHDRMRKKRITPQARLTLLATRLTRVAGSFQFSFTSGHVCSARAQERPGRPASRSMPQLRHPSACFVAVQQVQNRQVLSPSVPTTSMARTQVILFDFHRAAGPPQTHVGCSGAAVSRRCMYDYK